MPNLSVYPVGNLPLWAVLIPLCQFEARRRWGGKCALIDPELRGGSFEGRLQMMWIGSCTSGRAEAVQGPGG